MLSDLLAERKGPKETDAKWYLLSKCNHLVHCRCVVVVLIPMAVLLGSGSRWKESITNAGTSDD